MTKTFGELEVGEEFMLDGHLWLKIDKFIFKLGPWASVVNAIKLIDNGENEAPTHVVDWISDKVEVFVLLKSGV